jgi:hypothetical protein
VRPERAAWTLASALATCLAACSGTRDHERLGDRAYGQARYADAAAEYGVLLKGEPEAGLFAKAGAAALHAGQLRDAAEAYLRLAGEDPMRTQEAAEGLDAVARAAERAGNVDVLREVVTGLQAVAPERVAGRYALLLAQHSGTDTTDVVALMPAALAAATDPGTVDSLLTQYGAALETTVGCGQALLQYRAVLRRSQDSAVRAPARRGVAGCAYALGLRADSAGHTGDAALWFAESARVDSTSPVGRRALLRYAGARLSQGDTLAAALAFQAVSLAGTDDSMGQAAAARLAALGTFPPAGDSARTGVR